MMWPKIIPVWKSTGPIPGLYILIYDIPNRNEKRLTDLSN